VTSAFSFGPCQPLSPVAARTDPRPSMAHGPAEKIRTVVVAPAERRRVTIVVVSYGRADEIRLCLRDLVAQRTSVPFEVVLMLQAYPAGMPEALAAEFSPSLSVSVYHSDTGLGVHGARNAALERANGEIVAFLDDDVRVPQDWLDALVSHYDDASVGGVGGFVRHPGSQRLSTRILRPLLGLSSQRYRIDWGGFHVIPWASHPAKDQNADWLSGCNMSFRREALDSVRGFDEGYGAYGYDDVDIGLRVRRAGWRLISTRGLTVAHHPSAINRASLPELVRAEETRRVRFVRRAIGHQPAWRARYIARLSWHLVALACQGIARGCPTLPLHAIRGAYTGLRLFGGPVST
jgi:GT2 family glycosyltransferase